MGVGFTAAMLCMGIIRELLGAGTVFGFPVLSNFMEPIIIFLLPRRFLRVWHADRPGWKALQRSAMPRNPPAAPCCPLAASCSMIQEKEACGRDSKQEVQNEK